MAGHSKWSEIKRRMSLTETRARARQATPRMIARGERPLFVRAWNLTGGLFFIRIPELDIATQARHRGEVASMARACIATWLSAEDGSFDVDVDDP